MRFILATVCQCANKLPEPIDETLLLKSLERYPKYKGKLSLTDVCSVLVMEKYGIRQVFSHDSDFDIEGLRRKQSL